MKVRASVFVAMTGLVVAAFGCQFIVGSDPPPFTCEDGKPGACPEGQTCSGGVCISGGAPVDRVVPTEDAEPLPDSAIPGTDARVDAGPARVGQACVRSTDCVTGAICADKTLLTSQIVADEERVCATSCCTSSDCPSGTVCFPAGTGGRYCVAAAKAARGTPGAKLGGDTCAGNSECRSGLCENTRCTDTCCLPEQCRNGTFCRLRNIGTHRGFACDVLGGGSADAGAGANCFTGTPNNCQSNLCFDTRCRQTCCGSKTCVDQGFTTGACQVLLASNDAGTDRVNFCYTTPGTKLAGEPCSELNEECRTGFCDPDTNKCAELCCTDADCAAPNKCRPASKGDRILRCGP